MVTVATAVQRSGADRARFVATIFVGSFLLFLVQPMIARMALPRLGGAPSVWNSAMLVYQLLLLGGYAYAHWLGRLRPPRQAVVHLALLLIAALTLPIGLMEAAPPPDANPFLWVPWLLLASIGPLFFVISAQAPLLQRWFALSRGADPYPLYAASNLGSFGGLLAYPLLVEPMLAVAEQRWLWSIGYAALIALVGSCALLLPRSAASGRGEAVAVPRPGWRAIASWIALAAVPSGLILSTTLHITTDLVAMPLLWVLPLGVYLLSFTVAFASRRGPAQAISRLAPLMLMLACFAVFVDQSWLALLFGVISIVSLFTASVALHSRLFDSRPDPQHLTLFYLAMSVGGALGGLFAALVAPLVFDWTYEHLVLLIAAAWLMRSPNPFAPIQRLWKEPAHARTLTLATMVLLAALAFAGKGAFGLPLSSDLNRGATIAIIAAGIFAMGNPALFTAAVAALLVAAGAMERIEMSAAPGKMTRSFFGVYSVRAGSNDSRVLVHGTTIHGIQNLGSTDRERMQTSYYAPASGVGVAMRAAPDLFGPQARIAVIGLGAGTLACYARPGQDWSFYEIDPVVVGIARDPKRFTFLARCRPDAQIKLGDARLLIEREPAGVADLLVVDAFSSDSVPMHLLTSEAFADYRRLLSPGGLLLVHISNRYLNLQPVVAGAAASGGWHAKLRPYQPDSERMRLNEAGSKWVAMSPSRQTLERLVSSSEEKWIELEDRRNFRPWTDNYASLLPLISLQAAPESP